jgi:hypothetical protein
LLPLAALHQSLAPAAPAALHPHLHCLLLLQLLLLRFLLVHLLLRLQD